MQMQVRRTTRQVLVADDDDATRTLIANKLRRAGIDVLEVRNGEELVAMVRALEASPDLVVPDLVISDVHMPEASGLEALIELKKIVPETPVIIVSGFLDARMEVLAKDLGASAVYDKPLDLGELRETVISFLGY
jgi:two-component system, response regulator, stage 0 sporulation protein F